jgi:hypothetical protein
LSAPCSSSLTSRKNTLPTTTTATTQTLKVESCCLRSDHGNNNPYGNSSSERLRPGEKRGRGSLVLLTLCTVLTKMLTNYTYSSGPSMYIVCALVDDEQARQALCLVSTGKGSSIKHATKLAHPRFSPDLRDWRAWSCSAPDWALSISFRIPNTATVSDTVCSCIRKVHAYNRAVRFNAPACSIPKPSPLDSTSCEWCSLKSSLRICSSLSSSYSPPHLFHISTPRRNSFRLSGPVTA